MSSSTQSKRGQYCPSSRSRAKILGENEKKSHLWYGDSPEPWIILVYYYPWISVYIDGYLPISKKFHAIIISIHIRHELDIHGCLWLWVNLWRNISNTNLKESRWQQAARLTTRGGRRAKTAIVCQFVNVATGLTVQGVQLIEAPLLGHDCSFVMLSIVFSSIFRSIFQYGFSL